MDIETHQFVAQVIATAMDEKGVSASMLADATGIPDRRLRSRLARQSAFTLAELDQISQFLGTRPSRVIERATVMQQQEHNEGNQP